MIAIHISTQSNQFQSTEHEIIQQNQITSHLTTYMEFIKMKEEEQKKGK